MSELEEVLKENVWGYTCKTCDGGGTIGQDKGSAINCPNCKTLGIIDWETNLAVKKVKDLFLELIGEDEVRPATGPKRNGIEQGLRRTRNRLRTELRQKVQSL